MSGAPDFFHGSVRVRVTGVNIERVLNDAAAKGIPLREVSRQSRREMRFVTSYRGFCALRPVFAQAKCRVKILKKRGMPYLRSRLYRRVGFAVGAVLCLFLVLGLSQVVWDVRFVGDVDGFRADALEEILWERNIRPGALRGEIDCREVSQAIMERVEGLTFAGVRMRGLVLEVELVEASPIPGIFDRETPVDVVAAQDGIVESLQVLEGRAVVRPGQEVKKGDVLIEGRAIGPGGEIDVHARGEAVLRVWITGRGEALLYRYGGGATGNYVNRRVVLLGGMRLPELPAQVFERQQIVRRDTQVLPGLFLPLALRLETVYEMDPTKVPRPAEEAEREAEQSAILAALEKLPEGSTVVDKRVEFSKMKDTTICATVHLQVLKDCGAERAR